MSDAPSPAAGPGAVDALEAIPMGSSAFFLIWKKPRETNGILTGYKVMYQTVTNLTLGPLLERTPQINDSRTTRAKLASLEPATKYRIAVLAVTSAGTGER